MMKEARKYELLTTLKAKSKEGQKIIAKPLETSEGEKVFISGLYFRKEELRNLKKTLEKACETQTLVEMKQILTEDTIPIGLLFQEDFWKEFSDYIDSLK